MTNLTTSQRNQYLNDISNTKIRNAIRALIGSPTDGAGSTTQATIKVTESGDDTVHRTLLTATGLPISVADDAGVAQYGGALVYTFPQGLIHLHGAIIDGALTMGATGTIIDAFTGVVALGSVVATTGATLITTEATWLQSTAMTTAVTKVAVCDAISIATQVTESGGRWYDGTTTAGPMFLNFAIADDVTHTAATGTFTGTIQFIWSNIGDK
jgi:hypothetical protein